MSSYYYVKDPDPETSFTPIPEEEYLKVIFRIAKKHGLQITDKMILQELKKEGNKIRHIR